MPDLHNVEIEQRSERECTGHLDVLRHQQELAAVGSVCENSADERKQHDRQLAQKQVQAEVERVFGEIVDQPALSELLHESPDGGSTCSQPHQAEVTVGKRSENSLDQADTRLIRKRMGALNQVLSFYKIIAAIFVNDSKR